MKSYLKRSIATLSNNKSIDDFNWSSLTYNKVNKLIKTLMKERKSPSTINAYLSCIKGTAKEAWNLKYIDTENYQKISTIKRIKTPKEVKGRYLSFKELNSLLDHCMAKDNVIAIRDAAIISAIYGAGLKRSEVINLPLDAYNSKTKEIRCIGKNGSVRIFETNKRISNILETWITQRGPYEGPLFTRIHKGNNITTKPITSQTVYDIIIRRHKEANLKPTTPHDLRKTFATNLLNRGEDIFTVKELMNHKFVETTVMYISKNKDRKQKYLAPL